MIDWVVIVVKKGVPGKVKRDGIFETLWYGTTRCFFGMWRAGGVRFHCEWDAVVDFQ